MSGVRKGQLSCVAHARRFNICQRRPLGYLVQHLHKLEVAWCIAPVNAKSHAMTRTGIHFQPLSWCQRCDGRGTRSSSSWRLEDSETEITECTNGLSGWFVQIYRTAKGRQAKVNVLRGCHPKPNRAAERSGLRKPASSDTCNSTLVQHTSTLNLYVEPASPASSVTNTHHPLVRLVERDYRNLYVVLT